MSDTPGAITLLATEDDPLLSTLLITLLSREPDFQVLGTARRGDETVDLVRRHRPLVLLLDLHLPDRNGLSVVEELAREPGPTRILVMSGDEGFETQVDVARAGGHGFLAKSAAFGAMAGVIRKIAAGEVHFTPAVTSHIFSNFAVLNRRLAEDQDPMSRLTEREREVLLGAARGLSNPELSRELYMSVSTVKSHLRSALQKLDLETRTDAVVFAMQRGLLDKNAPLGRPTN